MLGVGEWAVVVMKLWQFGGTIFTVMMNIGLLYADEVPEVLGSIEIGLELGNISSEASANSISSIAVGSVLEGRVEGDIRVVVETGDISSRTQGSQACSLINIASIGQVECGGGARSSR